MGKKYSIEIGLDEELSVEIIKPRRVSGCKLRFEFGGMIEAPVAQKSSCSAVINGECRGLESCVLAPADMEEPQVREGLLAAHSVLQEVMYFLLDLGQPLDYSMGENERKMREIERAKAAFHS